jgi:uncharacterized OB-fold protein
MRELEVQVCEGCDRAFFPDRALCPACGGRAFRCEPAGAGTVEETTVRGTVHVASVRLRKGPVVIARSGEDIAAGAKVALLDDDGAPVATA